MAQTTTTRRGLPEVPLDVTKQEEMRQFLLGVRQSIVALRGPTTPPSPPSNFAATPLAFSVLLQWTRGLHADGTEILWNTVAQLQGSTVIDAGSGNQHVDFVGSTTKRYYWIRSYDAHSPNRSSEVGPLAATPLTAGTSAAVPKPPPSGQSIVTDSVTGRTVDRYNPHGKGF